jgi:hypothetical protein
MSSSNPTSVGPSSSVELQVQGSITNHNPISNPAKPLLPKELLPQHNLSFDLVFLQFFESVMASATGIPERINGVRGTSEEEPLLGQRGDASQMEGQSLWMNLWLGMWFLLGHSC